MTNIADSMSTTAETDTWQLNALTEALGDLTLTVNDSLSVGRGSDNDVVLGSKQVSRNHAVLSILDGQLYVKDLDSSNGTFINDQRIAGNESNLLQVDDTLGFASFSFQVQVPAITKKEEVLAPVELEDLAAEISPATEEVVTEISSEETVDEKPIIEEQIIEEPTVSEPVVKQTGIEEILPTIEETETLPVDTTSDTVTEAIIAPTIDETEVAEPVSQESIVKETGIDEVLSAAENASPAPIEDVITEIESTPEVPVSAETELTAVEPEAVTTTEKPTPTVSNDNEPLVEQPVVREEPAVREESAVQAEHDKTTKTELQEEADPDVLRAKQAATAQFSGTANLGQSRDLGTEGNNAMDQEISNPAHTGQVEKKSSGGWFIWVFAAILIIGLALWLFNKGIV